jgi:cobalamin biosynthesis Mg chelatase CobN
LIPAAANQPARGALRVLGLLAVFAAMLAVASPAAAASSCGRAVIDDWYDNGRVDGTYALHCYDDAIETLPRDVRDYSSAKDDIQRALQARKRGEPAPPASTDPTPGDGSTTPEDPDDPNGTGTDTTGSASSGGSDDPPTGNEAGGAVDTDADSASSVPIPLLILAGLALLLVAAGCAGYVIRRVQARRLPPSTSS